MIRSGLDRLLDEAGRRLRGRRFGLLAHGASITRQGEPAHLALLRAGHPPAALFGPEHGYYGVEQDMVAAGGGEDPLTGLPLVSLYGADESSLRPTPKAFQGLDLLLVDLQDVGSRYYTYAATAVWAAEAAAAAGCEVWVLDRPNPLGGVEVEGAPVQPGFESFVGAFAIPVRHGLTLAELVRLLARGASWEAALTCWPMSGWRRSSGWPAELPWVAPSPNMPSLTTARIYPGGCLLEATELSEGRGTTRPFQLLGAPFLDPGELAERLAARDLPGLRFVPTFFRPQFQKHAGEVCGGIEILVLDSATLRPYRLGIELLVAARACDPRRFRWRAAPYEFVSDRPAIDLLTGSDTFRRVLEAEDAAGLEDWIATWPAAEEAFRRRSREVWLYEE